VQALTAVLCLAGGVQAVAPGAAFGRTAGAARGRTLGRAGMLLMVCGLAACVALLGGLGDAERAPPPVAPVASEPAGCELPALRGTCSNCLVLAIKACARCAKARAAVASPIARSTPRRPPRSSDQVPSTKPTR
jgi:hypothetical protein